MLNRGGFRVAPQTLFIMLLQYKTADRFLLAVSYTHLTLPTSDTVCEMDAGVMTMIREESI